MEKINTIGNSTKSGHAAGRIVSTEGIAPTVMENHGAVTKIAYDEQNRMFRKDGTVGTLTTDGSSPKHNNRVVEIAAMRGRDTASDKTEQRLEKNGEGVTNALTTVQKDNLVCENIDIQCLNSKVDGKQPSLGDRIYSDEGCSSAIATAPFFTGSIQHIRIRKLTTRECWRLMGFSDEDFDRAKAVNSDSQLYKQAGNSIVVDVLAAIFGRMV